MSGEWPMCWIPRHRCSATSDGITDGLLDERAGFYGPRLQEQARDGELRDLVSERWESASPTALAAARFDQRLYLCDDILQKADRASMWASLEMRTPFLDRTLVEFSATVAPELHMAGGGKNLLRRVLRRTLPGTSIGRKKTAFRVPVADWLRGPLASTRPRACRRRTACARRAGSSPP